MKLFHLYPFINLIPFFLYAETHFRIPGIFNRLFKREPEILVDVPHRVQQGQALPVLLMIKDSHRFPVTLEKLVVHANGREFSFLVNQVISTRFWHHIYYIELSQALSKPFVVDTWVHLQCRGRRIIIQNDNFRTASHAAFQVEPDQDLLPGSDRCVWADLHCHSCYTDDQMEFGPPLAALQAMARAIGISVVAVTDHSYDLDNEIDNYDAQDPQLGKWHSLHESIAELNKNGSVLFLAGEEISVGNVRGKNIHMLILNDQVFYHGHGDSGDKWLQIKPQFQCDSLLKSLSPESAAFAAHPEARPPWPQRLLLGRDKWYDEDYAAAGLHGLEIWNGEGASGFEEGLVTWVRQLLNGRRLPIIGGNDSHGDFNRVRHIKIPFWSILESSHHIFGRVRTGILTSRPASSSDIMALLKQGRSLVSNGPFAQLTVGHNSIGDTVREKCTRIEFTVSSSAAFGCISRIDLFIADLEKKQEVKRTVAVPPASMLVQQQLGDISLPDRGYIRLEASSEKNGTRFDCFTNPVYLDVRTV